MQNELLNLHKTLIYQNGFLFHKLTFKYVLKYNKKMQYFYDVNFKFFQITYNCFLFYT